MTTPTPYSLHHELVGKTITRVDLCEGQLELLIDNRFEAAIRPTSYGTLRVQLGNDFGSDPAYEIIKNQLVPARPIPPKEVPLTPALYPTETADKLLTQWATANVFHVLAMAFQACQSYVDVENEYLFLRCTEGAMMLHLGPKLVIPASAKLIPTTPLLRERARTTLVMQQQVLIKRMQDLDATLDQGAVPHG